MGIAAYQRGSEVIARQADADVAQALPRLDRAAAMNRVAELDRQLRQEREEAARTLDRARRVITLLRAEKAIAAEALSAEKESHESTRGMLRHAVTCLHRVTRSWRKASALLRLLPAETVSSLREMRDA